MENHAGGGGLEWKVLLGARVQGTGTFPLRFTLRNFHLPHAKLDGSLTGVSVSWHCCNKVAHTGWPKKKTEVYSLTVLERTVESEIKAPAGLAASCSSEGQCASQLRLSFRCCWRSLVYLSVCLYHHSVLFCVCVFIWCSLLSMCLSLCLLFLRRHWSYWIKGPPYSSTTSP